MRGIAADHRLAPDPASVSERELGPDTAHSATIAPVRAVLLTGSAAFQAAEESAAKGPSRADDCAGAPKDEAVTPSRSSARTASAG